MLNKLMLNKLILDKLVHLTFMPQTKLPIKLLVLLIGCLGLGMAGCRAPAAWPTPPPPTAAPPLPAFVWEIDAATLPALVVAEREASITGNLPLLATLWADDARIVDGRGSVNTDDDYLWAGRAAILDRYALAVFPAPPPPLTLDEIADATLLVDGDRAILHYANDQWRFIQRDGRWWLHELMYSVP